MFTDKAMLLGEKCPGTSIRYVFLELQYSTLAWKNLRFFLFSQKFVFQKATGPHPTMTNKQQIACNTFQQILNSLLDMNLMQSDRHSLVGVFLFRRGRTMALLPCSRVDIGKAQSFPTDLKFYLNHCLGPNRRKNDILVIKLQKS